MTETISVSVSGIAFSLLSYENVKSEYNQEGFLLGNINCKESNRVTDADHQVLNREYIINVKSIIPCPHQFYFYDASGKINEAKIKNVLDDQQTKVIGWYIFKRKHCSPTRLTFREKIIHKQLGYLFNLPESQFTCCLLSLEYSSNKSTHLFCQTFIRYRSAKYESLPLHVINLTDPKYIFESSESTSDFLSKLITNIKQSKKCDEHTIVQKVQDGLQKHMKILIEQSYGKEAELFNLEQEIKQLKQNIKLNHENNAIVNNIDHKPEQETVLNESSESQLLENNQITTGNTFDISKRKRARLGKNVQNDENKNISNVCNADGDNLKDNTPVAPKYRTRLQTNASKAEIAQNSKN